MWGGGKCKVCKESNTHPSEVFNEVRADFHAQDLFHSNGEVQIPLPVVIGIVL